MQRGSIYCALHFDADAAFDASAGSYCFAAGGQVRTQSELVDYYVSLCSSEPLLRCLVAPFSPRDDTRAEDPETLNSLPLTFSLLYTIPSSLSIPFHLPHVSIYA